MANPLIGRRRRRNASGLTAYYVGPGLSCAIGPCALTRSLVVNGWKIAPIDAGALEASAVSGYSYLPDAVNVFRREEYKGGEVPVQRLLPDSTIETSGRFHDEEGKCVSYSAPSYMTNSHSAHNRAKRPDLQKRLLFAARPPRDLSLRPLPSSFSLSVPYKRSRHRIHLVQKRFRAIFLSALGPAADETVFAWRTKEKRTASVGRLGIFSRQRYVAKEPLHVVYEHVKTPNGHGLRDRLIHTPGSCLRLPCSDFRSSWRTSSLGCDSDLYPAR